MRPHQPTTHAKATGLGRARMLMKAKLGWLTGYPSAGAWVVVPSDERGVERLALGRDHLRRATRTANELRRDFPRALPVLVGDVEAWHASVTEVIAALKPWVHHGHAPPAGLFEGERLSRAARARARALGQQHPALRGLVDAISWMLATHAASAPKALVFVERQAAALEAMHAAMGPEAAVVIGLELVHLALALGPKAVAPLVRLLGEPAAHHVLTHAVGEHVNAIVAAVEQRGRALPVEPRARAIATAGASLRWLLGRDPTVARRWLGLLSRCDVTPLLHAWEQWWPPLRKLAARGHALCNDPHHEGRERSQRLASLRRQVMAHRAAMPRELHLPALLEALPALADAGFEPGYGHACRILERIPEPQHAILRAGLVLEWSHLHASPHPWWSPRRLPVLLQALDEHLGVRPLHATRLSPWLSQARSVAARGRGGRGVAEELLEQERGVPHIASFFAALRWLEAHAPDVPIEDIVRAVAHQVEALPDDPARAACLAAALHRADHHAPRIAPATLRAAWRICAPEPDGYVPVVRALERIESETGLEPARLVDGMSLGPGGDLGLLRELLGSDDLGALVRCGRKLAVLHALGQAPRVEPPVADRATAWLEPHPAALRDDLVWLAAQTNQAESIAAKVLRSLHHAHAAIDEEQRAIAAMLAQASPERAQALRARLVTLERRRSAPPPAPSPAKLERVRAKLRRRGALARLEALEAAADAILPRAVARELGLPAAPPWALEERVLSLLIPLRQLDAPTRRLARTLARARAGAPPWDLREHPANAAFLSVLRRRGIDPAPWLDGIGTAVEGRGDGRMWLALEDDPLEVFHMGRHFGTCLSPGHCNFFSVFANAADVNKRVLMARDGRGTVLGRRLLCLTSDGHLLAFNAYCHDATRGFDEASAAFARRLADAMGTAVVARGEVPRLVSPAWYDDGPIDIAGQLDVLADGSELRLALAHASAADLPSILSRAFERPKLDEWLAPMVLALPELLGRTELARTLLALVRHPERLPLSACERLSALLVEAGAADDASTMLTAPMVTALLQQHRDHRWMSPEGLAALTAIAPSRTLELLRRTRAQGVRSWEAEPEIERLIAAGLAMEALHRPAQAIRVYRRALEALGYDGHRRVALERLAILDPAHASPAGPAPGSRP